MLRDSEARVVRVEKENDYCLISLLSPVIAEQSKPGQFIMIRVSPLQHPLLRRPLSLHAVEKDCIEIFFQKQGIGTDLLLEKREGESLDIVGPLGQGFSFGSDLKGKTVLLIGGGRGMGPLYFLAESLRKNGIEVTILYGGRTKSDLPLRKKCEKSGFNIFCSTDDGSYGFKGLVSALFSQEIKKIGPAKVFSCGPEAMMKEISRICLEEKVRAEFSLESIMGCGFGACWGCVRRIRRDHHEKWVKICEEGPVFSLESIVWNGVLE